MTLPFVMPASSVFFESPRRVFAHYFYPFPLSIGNQPAATDYYNTQYLTPGGEGGVHAAYGGYLRQRPLPVPVQPASANYLAVNMQTEVEMAIARGITGFVFDILSLGDVNPPTASKGRLSSLIAAEAAVDSRFSIIPMLDMSSLGNITPAQGAAVIQAIAQSTNLYRYYDGRIVVAAYDATLQPLSWYQQMITILNAANIDIAFWPVFLGAQSDAGTLDPISAGIGGWGTAIPSSAAALATTVKSAQTTNAPPLPFLMPILPQQFRPKDQIFQEAQNSLAFRNAWMSAIASEAAAVQIVTWSDFSESGQIQPYTDATLALNIGTGFYDLNAYYATWFATGVQPPITQEVLYWFHRRMANSAAHPNQKDNFTCAAGTETDNIELLAFLMEPGTLSINGKTLAAPAGITSFLQPIAPGNPAFALKRNGSNVLAFSSPITIYGPEGSPAGVTDLTYWCGSVAD
jgi:Glycosyl hydrolase family 71